MTIEEECHMALRDLALEVLVWFRRQNEAAALKAVEPVKRGPGRPPKVPPISSNPVVASNPPGTMVETGARVLEVAKLFVQRFQNSTPDGLTMARTILDEKFSTDKIGNLTPLQQLEFISILEKRLIEDGK